MVLHGLFGGASLTVSGGSWIVSWLSLGCTLEV